MDKKYICPCGLICTDCLFYKPEIYDNAKKLRNGIKNSQLDIFLKSITESKSWKIIADHFSEERINFGKYFEAFNNFQDFMNALEGFDKLQCKSTCRETGGCSMGGTLHKCEAVKCVKSKGYEGCWDCPENEDCHKLNFVKKVYGETIKENFKIMKEQGCHAIKSQGNKYYAWQRKMKN